MVRPRAVSALTLRPSLGAQGSKKRRGAHPEPKRMRHDRPSAALGEESAEGRAVSPARDSDLPDQSRMIGCPAARSGPDPRMGVHRKIDAPDFSPVFGAESSPGQRTSHLGRG